MSTLAVVIPVRNMASTLRRAVSSAVLGGADEVVIVDDASDDGTDEVAARCSEEWKCVSIVTHSQKSEDHNIAQEAAWRSVQSDQIVGLAADDFLYPGAIWSLKLAPDAPVVFSDYDVFDKSSRYLYSQCTRFYGRRTAAEIRSRFATSDYVTETGFCAAIRRDISSWLWTAGWQTLGPMMDTVGLMTAASLFGASYIPVRCGAFFFSTDSYGHNSNRDAEWYFNMGTKAVDWVRSCGLDSSTVKGIARLRCCLNDKFFEEVTQ
jgi:glycosyltransferase involved in cell wall biosynthesis